MVFHTAVFFILQKNFLEEVYKMPFYIFLYIKVEGVVCLKYNTERMKSL